MVVGVLRVRLAIFEALSLKDKRRVTKSLKDRVRARYNISVAEVDDLDRRQAATLAFAMVSNERRHVDSALRKVVELVRMNPQASLIDFDIEFV